MTANAQVPMVQAPSTPTKGPPMGLIIGGVVLIVVIIVIIVILNMGSSPAAAPAPAPAPASPWALLFPSPAPALSPAPAPAIAGPAIAAAPVPVYTTGSQNITALISGMNGVWGSRVSNCPNVIQQMATWADSMGIIAVPQGASCPSSAPTAWPLGGNSNSGGIIMCYPQNAPPATTQPPTAIATLLTQCMQAGAPPQVGPDGKPLK